MKITGIEISGKQIQWAALVLGATCYFFIGALTEVGLPLQFGTFIGVAVVLPALVTRRVSFQQPPLEGDTDDEYRL